MKRKFISICTFCILANSVSAQIPSDYGVQTWQGGRSAAVSYTFDDLTSNQLPVAKPLFNNYGYKMTFNVVTDWLNGWSGLQTAGSEGHEIASHTVSHASLGNLDYNGQKTELENSQKLIQSNIGSRAGQTIAYPNCVNGDQSLISSYYIAGRICSNQIVSKSPSDFYAISSIICGSESSVTSADHLNSKIQSAKNSNGWCVFLFHGIDNDGGYSSFSSTQLGNHLSYVNTNDSDYWVATFADAAKYIKERDNASITETAVSVDSLVIALTDGLDDTIYDVALTITRKVPATWEDALVYNNGTLIEHKKFDSNGTTYIQFDVLPDTDIAIANSASEPAEPVTFDLKAGWNLIAYPTADSLTVTNALESVWDQFECVKNENTYFLKNNALNTMEHMRWGTGYMLKVSADCILEIK